jgi:hypothetical protein
LLFTNPNGKSHASYFLIAANGQGFAKVGGDVLSLA